jgi:hypothetical protein
MTWLPANNPILESLFFEGKTDEEMATALNSSKKTIRYRRYTLGLKHPAPLKKCTETGPIR